jgi:hypothetical protein
MRLVMAPVTITAVNRPRIKWWASIIGRLQVAVAAADEKPTAAIRAVNICNMK